MNHLSLFTGIGGLDLGFERAGMTTVGQVELDPFCRAVLVKHWPEVPRHDDVATAVDWWRGGADRPAVDLVSGGFPCQPSSQAGRKAAQRDPRWLWPLMAAVIGELRPAWVVFENVSGLLDRGLADVRRDLTRGGYELRVGEISACALGAPHARSRLFGIAHTAGLGRCPWRHDAAGTGTAGGQLEDGRAARRSGWWTTEPRVARMAYGVPGGVDQRRALGNAVVPQVAEHLGRLLVAADQEARRAVS